MIQTHGNSFIQNPILIGNIKAQLSLATLKPNSYWQYKSPIFIGTILSKRKRAQDYQCLVKKKNIMVKCYRGKKDHGNHLIKAHGKL